MKEKQAFQKGDILRHFYFGGILSCSEISLLTRKSLPIATRMINELLDEGVLIETGFAHSTGGRRPQTYSLAPDNLHVISVAMDQYVTRLTLMDAQNRFLSGTHEIQLPLPANPAALSELAEHLEHFIRSCGTPRNKIVGIGIGMPGFVDVSAGLNHSFLPPPPGESIVSFLQKKLDLPVLIDNDSSLIALAEYKFGTAKDHPNAMVINIGWGVGLGMILNGELYRGNNGFAGEFSHMPIFTNNKMCSCGKLGCLETETSLMVMVNKAKDGIRSGHSTSLTLRGIENMTLKEAAYAILAEALRGDRFVVELLGEIGYSIGRGISILIHILNPSNIVLSGRGSAAGRLWLAPVQKAINEHCIPRIAEKTTIEVSTIGSEAELIGAAALVMEHIEATMIYKTLKSKKLEKKEIAA